MSIILAKPAGVDLTKEKVEGEIFLTPPHAISYVYAKDGKLYHEKFKLFSDNCIWDKLKILKPYSALLYACEKPSDNKILRLKNKYQCPILINNEIAAAVAGEIGSTRLDSKFFKAFINKTLNPMIKKIPNLLFMDAGKWIIERFISFEGAMIAMNSSGEINIFNKSHGEVVNDVWEFDSFLHTVRYNRRHMCCE